MTPQEHMALLAAAADLETEATMQWTRKFLTAEGATPEQLEWFLTRTKGRCDEIRKNALASLLPTLEAGTEQ